MGLLKLNNSHKEGNKKYKKVNKLRRFSISERKEEIKEMIKGIIEDNFFRDKDRNKPSHSNPVYPAK